MVGGRDNNRSAERNVMSSNKPCLLDLLSESGETR